MLFQQTPLILHCFASGKNVSMSLDESRHLIALYISLHGERPNLYGNMADLRLFELGFFLHKRSTIPLIFKPQNIRVTPAPLPVT